MKKLILYFLTLGIGISTYAMTAPKKVSHPQLPSSKDSRQEKLNVIFFLADDLGWSDVGYQGSSFYETPYIMTIG